jgi:hypothetical protein
VKLIDLFPPCQAKDEETCPNPPHSTGHKTILPWQQEFLHAPEKFLGAVGGYGSGKTLPANVLGVALSLKIPGNRGIVIRRSYPKLHDPTERVFLEVLQRSGIGFTPAEMRDKWPHRVILENGSEIFFRESSEPGKFLGPEYGWFYIDEAVEEPEATFNALVGRLRLSLAGQALKGIITTNPPNSPPYAPHWIEKKFGRESGVTVQDIEGQKIRFRLWRMATKTNPFLPKDYVSSLLATHSPEEVRRILSGEFVHYTEGRPVYPQFEFSKHVGAPNTHLITLVRVWDFGFNQPAVTWHQFVQCKFRKLHWHILYEYMPSNIESEELARHVLEHTKTRFPEHPRIMILDGGDTAGAQVNEHGPGPIIRLAKPINQGGFGLQFKHKKFKDLDPGLDLVRKVLREKCPCGFPMMLIHRDCRTSIQALAGGYHYPKQNPGKSAVSVDKPVKDGYYDNVADTIRYAGELFYRPASRDPDFMAELLRDFNIPGEDFLVNDHSWMGRY